MKYTFLNLDKAIEKWLARKLKIAINEKSARSHLFKEMSKLNDVIRNPESILSTTSFKQAYKNYVFGNVSDLDNLFLDDNSIVGLLTNKQKQICLDEGSISIISSKERKKTLGTKKNSLNFQGEKIRSHDVTRNMPEKYKIQDKELCDDIFKTYKLCIFYMEVKSKLETNESIKSTEDISNEIAELKALLKEYKESIVIVNGIEASKSSYTESKEIRNPYPEIFKNRSAYDLFIELKNILVDDKTKVAGYSFIYHKMKFKGIKAINTSITEPGFIEFLNDNFGTKITAVKLPFRDPKAKRQAYNIILAKYVSSIKVNPSQD